MSTLNNFKFFRIIEIVVGRGENTQLEIYVELLISLLVVPAPVLFLSPMMNKLWS